MGSLSQDLLSRAIHSLDRYSLQKRCYLDSNHPVVGNVERLCQIAYTSVSSEPYCLLSVPILGFYRFY
jgi:hypothetical protein